MLKLADDLPGDASWNRLFVMQEASAQDVGAEDVQISRNTLGMLHDGGECPRGKNGSICARRLLQFGVDISPAFFFVERL